MTSFDSYDAYLFDIDGTLLNCEDAVHYFAFCDTLTWVAGRPLNLDGVVTHGNTDVGILRDAFRAAGVAEEVWRARLPEARERMCNFVTERTAEFRITVLPCVVELLTRLRDGGKVLGVATGNLAEIGRAKLRSAGLLPHFNFGGYSDEYEYRCDVFAAAALQARQSAGGKARLCVIGDTPEDIRAARANSLDVIAVATGIFPPETLSVEHPNRCVGTLRELMPEFAAYLV